jgi:protein-S-isoprenylcysteine O-methyltransferase Ste14
VLKVTWVLDEEQMKSGILTLLGATTAVVAVFGIAGKVAWWNAWIFLVFVTLLGTCTSRLINKLPGLAEERRTAAARAVPWDLKLVKLINLALPVMVIVAALDMRFRWIPAIPGAISVAAFAAMIPSVRLTYRAIGANAFFSSHIRIQEDRGHVVVSAGPYRVIRHPGYAGAVLFNFLVPFALGSWPALIPGLATVVLLIYRTAREDQMLMAELPGYTAYAQQVRSRLMPEVW